MTLFQYLWKVIKICESEWYPMHKFVCFLVNYIIIHSWISELQVILVILWMNLQNKEIEIKSGAKSA